MKSRALCHAQRLRYQAISSQLTRDRASWRKVRVGARKANRRSEGLCLPVTVERVYRLDEELGQQNAEIQSTEDSAEETEGMVDPLRVDVACETENACRCVVSARASSKTNRE